MTLRGARGSGAALVVPSARAVEAPVEGDHASVNRHLWQVYSSATAKSDVLPLVRRQLAVLAEQLAKPLGPAAHDRLCASCADLFQLAGEIFLDTDAYTEAAHCYALASQAGREAADFDLWACALTRHAYLSVYERQFATAVPMLEFAATLASRGDSALSTRHWVAAVQAEVYAGVGDLAACQRALDAAEQVRDLPWPVHNGGWLRFDGARLVEERGTCYAQLGQVDLAEAVLSDALS